MLHDMQRVLATYWKQFLYLSPKLIIALLIVVVALVVANRASKLLGARVRNHSDDLLLADFLIQFSKWVLVLAGFLLALQVIGFSGVVTGLLSAAGLSAFIVGFAFKDIAENFLAGVILAFNRPFQIHDTVEVKGLQGHVEALNLRTTIIRTFDGKHIYLPNSVVLKEPLTNFTRNGSIRQDFLLSVDYGQDAGPEKVMALILKKVQNTQGVQNQEPRTPYVLQEKGTGTTVDLRVYFWTFSEDYRRVVLELKSNLMQETRAALQAAGYALPNATQ
ncbi:MULTISPECIES: mechanosensitive ion channel family protein [Hymenobacter]|uniref:Mechanosensitive ion channel family protein n=2 Tax=Hymenobacter TaxID=89966 RepID=A0ABS6WZJ7_9BACT|nr:MULTISPECIES: mechanosensitive ion channel family protein [Hymenobacter]MBO3270919.1 mechanosensitive ion channel family protein [Hymenobacter defluvii]MBW3128173.1 mechanosensitive ion channel family protein [Hymenobacter profundi]QNE39631.1 mechanosensitive ion channel family protein [Hymenobacter sp. NBH84]